MSYEYANGSLILASAFILASMADASAGSAVVCSSTCVGALVVGCVVSWMGVAVVMFLVVVDMMMMVVSMRMALTKLLIEKL